MLAGVGHSRPWAPSLGPGVALSPSRARALPRPRIPARVQPSAAPRSSPRTQSAPSPSTSSTRAESPSARAGIPRALPRSRAPSMLTPTREPACISDGMGRAPRTHHARHPNPSHASRILAIPAGFQRMLPPFQDAIRPARQHASVPAYQHSTCWHASTVLQLPRHAATLPPCVHAQSRACLKNPSPWDSSVLPPS
jgi:hypothetical protein